MDNLGSLVLKLVPVLVVAALAYFVYVSNRAQRMGVLLAWIFPGLGHFYLGHRSRGILFAGMLAPLFLAGMVLAQFANISPFDRHPIWGLAQAPGGLMTLLAWVSTRSVKIAGDNPYYAIGCLYSGTACLLNLLALCDVWDLAGPKQRGAAGSTPEGEPQAS